MGQKAFRMIDLDWLKVGGFPYIYDCVAERNKAITKVLFGFEKNKFPLKEHKMFGILKLILSTGTGIDV